MKRKRRSKRRLKKIFRTNVDTISLNMDEVCPGFMRPSWTDVVINPRKYYKKGVEISR